MTRSALLPRRGWAGVVAIVLTGAGASLFGLNLSTAGAGAGQGAATDGDRVIVCESGVVDHGGGVETSSAVAIRVPEGEGVADGAGVQPLPGGMDCRDD